jgi:hypothetical protein
MGFGHMTNKAERSAAEPVEARAEAKGNAGQRSTRRTQSRISVSKVLARIRQLFAVDTRGGSRMRESGLYGSVRGGREATRVPTAPSSQKGGSFLHADSVALVWLLVVPAGAQLC